MSLAHRFVAVALLAELIVGGGASVCQANANAQTLASAAEVTELHAMHHAAGAGGEQAQPADESCDHAPTAGGCLAMSACGVAVLQAHDDSQSAQVAAYRPIMGALLLPADRFLKPEPPPPRNLTT